jgi:hypothetical protein
MQLCNVKYLKAVDGNPVGREVSGVVRDELIDKWEEMGLIRVTPTDETDGTPPETALGDTQAVQQPSLDPTEGGDPFGGATPVLSDPKAVWRDWLDRHGIEYRSGATKAELIEAWGDSRG